MQYRLGYIEGSFLQILCSFLYLSQKGSEIQRCKGAHAECCEEVVLWSVFLDVEIEEIYASKVLFWPDKCFRGGELLYFTVELVPLAGLISGGHGGDWFAWAGDKKLC